MLLAEATLKGIVHGTLKLLLVHALAKLGTNLIALICTIIPHSHPILIIKVFWIIRTCCSLRLPTCVS